MHKKLELKHKLVFVIIVGFYVLLPIGLFFGNRILFASGIGRSMDGLVRLMADAVSSALAH